MTVEAAGGPLVPFLENVAKVIYYAQRQPHAAPYHVAGALLDANLLLTPHHGEHETHCQLLQLSLRMAEERLAERPDLIDVVADCDWGDCDDPVVAVRWSQRAAAYLSVCDEHRDSHESNDEAAS